MKKLPGWLKLLIICFLCVIMVWAFVTYIDTHVN